MKKGLDYGLVLLKPEGLRQDVWIRLNELIAEQGLTVVEVRRQTLDVEEVLTCFTSPFPMDVYARYLASGETAAILVRGESATSKTRKLKLALRQEWNVTRHDMENLIHTADHGTEYYRQFSLLFPDLDVTAHTQFADLHVVIDATGREFAEQLVRLDRQTSLSYAGVVVPLGQFSDGIRHYNLQAERSLQAMYGLAHDVYVDGLRFPMIGYLPLAYDTTPHAPDEVLAGDAICFLEWVRGLGGITVLGHEALAYAPLELLTEWKKHGLLGMMLHEADCDLQVLQELEDRGEEAGLLFSGGSGGKVTPGAVSLGQKEFFQLLGPLVTGKIVPEPIHKLCKLERIIGVKRQPAAGSSELVYPTGVEELSDGNLLIVDADAPSAKIRIVSRQGEIVWQMPDVLRDRGMSFRSLRMLHNGHLLGADRNGQQVVEFTQEGKIIWTYAENSFAPVSADRLSDGCTAIVDQKQRRVLVVDVNGSCVFVWQPDVSQLLEPSSVRVLANGHLLVTDEELHIVSEMDLSGTVVWRYGQAGNPGDAVGQITYPMDAYRLPNGNTLIANTSNNQVIEVAPDGQIVWSLRNPQAGSWKRNVLFAPTAVSRTRAGHTLIADSRNHRVIEVNATGEIVWSYGQTDVEQRLFSFPRSLQLLDDGHLLIADTMHNRILELDAQEQIVWSSETTASSEAKGLFWPRCALRMPDGRTLIADGRNGRLVVVDRTGSPLREIRHFSYRGQMYEFLDPHYIKTLSNGNWLVVDSLRNTVVEIDEDQRAVWLYGPECERYPSPLNDPHRADRNEQGETLIVDSANRRLLIVSAEGEVVWELSWLMYNGKLHRLHWPRFAEFIQNDRLVVMDGKLGVGFVLTRSGHVVEIIEPDQPIVAAALGKTRDVAWAHDEIAYISDNANSQILKVCIKEE